MRTSCVCSLTRGRLGRPGQLDTAQRTAALPSAWKAPFSAPLPPRPRDSVSPSRPSARGTSSVKPSWPSLPGSRFPVVQPLSPCTCSHCVTAAPVSLLPPPLPAGCPLCARGPWAGDAGSAPAATACTSWPLLPRGVKPHPGATSGTQITRGPLTGTAAGRTRRATAGRRGRGWSRPRPRFCRPTGSVLTVGPAAPGPSGAHVSHGTGHLCRRAPGTRPH